MIPRQEHPKPQMERAGWLNLNGTWDFEIDNGRSGLARGLSSPEAKLAESILVPFCPESRLSGVEHKDFMYGVWYRRKVELTQAQTAGCVFLHFGAVDYACEVFVNGQSAGTHKGGYVSFRFDVTKLVQPGENVITVYAEDDTRDPMIPTGKQCMKYASYRCNYTRTTGIWQTVWLEFVPQAHLESVRYETDAESGAVAITAQTAGRGTLRTEIFYEGRKLAEQTNESCGGRVMQVFTLPEIHLWEPGCGRLYDVIFTYGEDTVRSYFGLRSIRMDDRKFYLNGRSVFQRLILDQGFYPDGICTAPEDAELAADIDRAMTMGFNGARLHEKIFEERFLYYCDKKGYLVWGEYPSWGLDHSRPEAIYSVLPEWLEELERDRNHPAIIGWCPFNETWDKNERKQYDDLLRMIYRVTKAVDPSRPCIDTSGHFHVETDIFDIHDYEQDPMVLRPRYDAFMETGELYNRFVLWEQATKGRVSRRQEYTGGPVMVSEFGGIRWTGEAHDWDYGKSWGYGKDVADDEDFKARFKGLCEALLNNDRIFGFCYTQLTDVEQGQNGLYTYDRQAKFAPEWVRSVVAAKAAIEE